VIEKSMNPRPRFTSRLTGIRNAVLSVVLRPFRWFSATTQLGIGFVTLVVATTLLLTSRRLDFHFLLVLLLVIASYLFAWRFTGYRARLLDLRITKRRAFALLGSAILVETAVMRLGFIVAGGLAAQSTRAPLHDPDVWDFAIPFAAASLLVTMLLDWQLGFIAGIIVSGFSALMAPSALQTAAYALLSCSAAAFGIKRYRDRQAVTLAGLIVAAVNGVAALALTALAQQHLAIDVAATATGMAICGGLLTIIFASGGVPINESLFGILTDVRLLELSNADLPVLSQLALRAPGTNQHSHAMGRLAEDACRAIGANALLARVGSLYHDIGKVAAPDHFFENQTGENPHDRLRPSTSARIITSHVTYGLRLAKEIGLPRQVADFIPQHHGTRTLHFFLRKAEEQSANGEKINEAEFRYPGPKPQFKEAAILMLADSCEAAARSLAHPDSESISEIVARIFDAIQNDGQLQECNLNKHDLLLIRDALIKSLLSIYHPRIDYPGFNVTAGSPLRNRGVGESPQHHQAFVTTRPRTYAKAADVPINPAGEVEDEAISRKAVRKPD
jgi:cyclic-di-AMP phosphodiesterase PgpH